jgi:hypothetical protein
MPYTMVEKTDVLTELNNGTEMYIVDFPTLRVMRCDEMTFSAVRSFIDKPEAMFFKVVANG